MRSLALITILLAFVGCGDMSNSSTPVTIKTPDGIVAATKTTVDPTPQTITPVAGASLRRLESLGEKGSAFVAAYLPDVADPDLKDFDEAFRVWQSSKVRKHSTEQVTEILGGWLGNKCVADFKMEWVTVTDEYGTDYAIRSKTVEVMAFPFSTVLKRIEKNENGFLYGVYHAIKQMVESDEYKRRDP